MPRGPRVAPPNSLHHVVSRGNRKQRIFHTPADFEAFLTLMGEACTRVPILLIDYCVMPNHFHLVLRQNEEGELSAYMQWLLTVHVRRYCEHYRCVGLGHVYQGRFKNSLVEHDFHLLNVCRYVVANPLRARLVGRAEDWPWSSLSPLAECRNRPPLWEPPMLKPPRWLDYVNGEISSIELEQLRLSARRGAPYGSAEWVYRTAEEHGLLWTLRPPHRPRIDESMLPVE